jgi:hypothetical protein
LSDFKVPDNTRNRPKDLDKANTVIEEPDEKAIARKLLDKAGVDSVSMNTSNEEIIGNVRENIRRGLPQAKPYSPQDTRVCIVGGGWSLNDTLEELRDLYWGGARLVAVNGSAKWLIEHNMKPSALVILDAREQNLHFLTDLEGLSPPEDLKYFFASQCHPSLFDHVKDRDSYIWHCWSTGTEEEKEVLDRYYSKKWIAVPGTTCVGFRSVCLFSTLGYRYFDIFGVDSCYRGETSEHHAYAQPENDGEITTEIKCGGRSFHVSGWQFVQACYFQDMVRLYGDNFFLSVHGDGLIAHMMKTGADLNVNGDEGE